MNSPELKCDVCGFETTVENSYILSTKEVTSSYKYWETQLSRFKPQLRSCETKDQMLNILTNQISFLADDKSPWMVCERCSDKFVFDKKLAKEYDIKIEPNSNG